MEAMTPPATTRSRTAQAIGASALLLVLALAGTVVMLVFFRQLLMPGNLAALSLPLVAVIAGVAATFNPCALPALPGFFAFGGHQTGAARKWAHSLAACLGAATVVLLFGIPVALLGTGVKDIVAPHFRWVQLAIGMFLICTAALHLMGQTMRLPLVATLMSVGNRMWDAAMGRPSAPGSYLFGAGYVAVGAG